MIGRLNHVAIVVPDLEVAAALYRETLGATVLAPQALPEHGVTAVIVELGNTRIELLERRNDCALGFHDVGQVEVVRRIVTLRGLNGTASSGEFGFRGSFFDAVSIVWMNLIERGGVPQFFR